MHHAVTEAPSAARAPNTRPRCWDCGKFVRAIQVELARRVAGPDAKPLCLDHHREAVAEYAVAGLIGHGAA